MYIDKIIKKEALVLFVSVSVLLIVIIGFSYSYFTSIDKGEDNVISVGDLKVVFCEDETCNSNYPNFGQVIGTKKVNNQVVIDSIYPYQNDSEALNNTPYIFNIKNTGSLDVYLTIKLKEDKDYNPGDINEVKSITELYSNNIKVGISDCSSGIDKELVSIYKYGLLENNIVLQNEILGVNQDKTYCLWTWLDENTPNDVQNSYFVANLEFKAEYKPK